jgi:starch-binding outer membrane protein SusE/F
MKRHFNKITLLAGLGLFLISSCSKNTSNDVVYLGGQAPILTASTSDSISLPIMDSTSTAVTFSWTNPNYAFSDGTSSLNVTYYLEFDTLGADFSSNIMQTIGLSSELSQTFTVSQLNNMVSNLMALTTGSTHNLQVRVESFLAPLTSGTAPAAVKYSSVLNFTVTPYALPPVVAPPSTGTLYITGSATNDGWMVGGSPSSVAGQQLTEMSPTMYTITLPLIGGQQFLIVPLAGDWTNKYGTNSTSGSPTGGTFGYNASNNFTGPVASGTYTVTFNFQSGLYTITAN